MYCKNINTKVDFFKLTSLFVRPPNYWFPPDHVGGYAHKNNSHAEIIVSVVSVLCNNRENMVLHIRKHLETASRNIESQGEAKRSMLSTYSNGQVSYKHFQSHTNEKH